MNQVLASLILEPEMKKVAAFSSKQKNFRFKCKRCAALCCMLGGPVLTNKDVERIENAGYAVKDFLEPVNKGSKSLSLVRGSMKSREDGSCIFLNFDAEQNCYTCNVYDFRPVLCRLYPFNFELVDSNSIVLEFIPCCRGLNNQKGELVDENFVSNYLLEPLLETIELHKKGVILF